MNTSGVIQSIVINALDWSMSHYIGPHEKSAPCGVAIC